MVLKDMYCTISEAAKELGVSRQTIYRWIADNKIPTEKIGGIILVEKLAVKKYEHRRTTASFIQALGNSIYKTVRKQFAKSDKDIVEKAGMDNKYLIFIVNHENRTREKIIIGGVDFKLYIGRDEDKPFLSSIKFDDVKIEEYAVARKSSKNKKIKK